MVFTLFLGLIDGTSLPLYITTIVKILCNYYICRIHRHYFLLWKYLISMNVYHFLNSMYALVVTPIPSYYIYRSTQMEEKWYRRWGIVVTGCLVKLTKRRLMHHTNHKHHLSSLISLDPNLPIMWGQVVNERKRGRDIDNGCRI